MKRDLLKTMLTVILLTAALAPGAAWISENQEKIQNDAKHIIEPIIKLYESSSWNGAEIAVEPMMDIEDAWDIADSREESQKLLVDGMRSNTGVLGCDWDNKTFYCTLGNDWQEGDPWPEIQLYAKKDSETDAQSLRVSWIDDYSYDDCAEAIRAGYAYELLAYTENEYSYFFVVFTGLPIVTVHVQEEEIGDEYIPACVSISAEDDGLSTVEMAQVHLRGNHRSHPKLGYRVEFQEISDTGRLKKKNVSALGMEADTDWLLISNAQDLSAVRNYLSFEMWKRWNEPEPALNMLENRLVEVFVQDKYMGMYQLMQRVDGERQIEKAGGNPKTDCLLRSSASPSSGNGKPFRDYTQTHGYPLVYQYEANKNANRVFRLAENYLLMSSLSEPLNDEEFAALAQQCVDLENLLSYYLFIQASGLTLDNTNNNLYIWIAKDGDRYVYRFGPWDMNNAVSKVDYNPDGSVYRYFDFRMEIARRILDLNIMNSREMLWKIWKEKRSTVLADDQIEKWIKDVEDEVYRSGAYRRESRVWLYNEQNLYLDDLLEFELEQMNTVETVLNEHWPINE